MNALRLSVNEFVLPKIKVAAVMAFVGAVIGAIAVPWTMQRWALSFDEASTTVGVYFAVGYCVLRTLAVLGDRVPEPPAETAMVREVGWRMQLLVVFIFISMLAGLVSASSLLSYGAFTALEMARAARGAIWFSGVAAWLSLGFAGAIPVCIIGHATLQEVKHFRFQPKSAQAFALAYALFFTLLSTSVALVSTHQAPAGKVLAGKRR